MELFAHASSASMVFCPFVLHMEICCLTSECLELEFKFRVTFRKIFRFRVIDRIRLRATAKIFFGFYCCR